MSATHDEPAEEWERAECPNGCALLEVVRTPSGTWQIRCTECGYYGAGGI